jgi:hypothetical protein
MKRLTLVLFLSLLGLVAIAKADIITLKDGTSVKGDILNQGPAEVVIEYFVTPTIKDQKTIPRDQIVKIDSIPKDDKAFVDLGDLSSPPTVLDTSYYDLLVDSKIPGFLARYPYSRHISELRDDLRLLEEERSRVRKGDRKLNGAWISSTQIQNDPYGFGSMIKFSEMKELAAKNDPVGALRCYEAIEKNYPGSLVMPDAVELALVQIGLLQGTLNSAKANFPIIDKSRQVAIAQAPADQAKQLRESIDRENVAAKGSIAAATADGTKFFPVFQNNKDALDALQAVVTSENARILQLQSLTMREGIKASGKCVELLAAGKIKEAQDQLALSNKLWPANIENIRLQRQIDQLSKAQATSGLKTNTNEITPKL